MRMMIAARPREAPLPRLRLPVCGPNSAGKIGLGNVGATAGHLSAPPWHRRGGLSCAGSAIANFVVGRDVPSLREVEVELEPARIAQLLEPGLAV